MHCRSVFRVPYEVIKQRMQCGMFDSTWAAIADCWRNEGITGLFGGGKLTSQIARDVPYAVCPPPSPLHRTHTPT